MKKLIVLFLFFILLAVYFFTKDKIGDLRPSLVPSSKDLVAEILDAQQTGSRPDIPLTLPEGFQIGVFESGLINVRDLQFTPTGTLLASLMKEGSVVALPDKNKDGQADGIYTVIKDLQKPHGIAFYKGKLFVAQEESVSRYSYDETNFVATFDKKLFDLPIGGRHKTRSIVFDKKGNLYVSLGSTCDTCIEKNAFIATVLISDSEGKSPRVYSKGLRNAVFLAVNPVTDEIYATEMGRDFLGNTTPPDEINILSDNGNFGWPFCYGKKVWDKNFGFKDESYCRNTISPIYEIPAHSAPLGITFIKSSQVPSSWQNDILVSYHGSWNSTVPVGYKIVRISTKGTPSEHDFITGFISGSDALGRPVDVEFDTDGSLYISDDKANAIYKVIAKP
ncbi:MAG: PQQ-dependent sugar dehydrogenase [Candidatus Levybacteria bacterium]|nr:PQQ-dependent sugar dehydrogenase [Candidatus Levybacteria bacterium]